MAIDTGLLKSQREWSLATFGENRGTEGNCKHIEKELAEVRADPLDIEEWIDIAMLAFDGAMRAGASPADVIDTYRAKLMKNQRRSWPTGVAIGEPIEHTAERE